MNLQVCDVSDLPDDLQVLVGDFVEDSLGERGLELMDTHWFEIHRVPVTAFPQVKMWTDYRNRAYADAMIGEELPPVLICGDHWLDGRHRVWVARRTGSATVDCIDLSEIGVCGRFERLGRLKGMQSLSESVLPTDSR